MITQIFSFPINPEPWKVGPAYRAGAKGVRIGADPGNAAFKKAMEEELERAGAYMMEPEYSLDIFTWRKREQYKSKTNRNITKKVSDATNMQKLIEDGLSGIVFKDDDTVVDIHTHQVQQHVDAVPMVVLVARGGLTSEVFTATGDPLWMQHVPADVRHEVEQSYEMARLRQSRLKSNVSELEESNRW